MIDLTDATPDYGFYIDTFNGTLSEDDFNSSLQNAIAEVRSYIYELSDYLDYADRIKMAICAMIETIGDSDSRLTSYKAGEVSENFNVQGDNFSIDSNAIVERYLLDTGILKKGKWL